MSTAETPTPSRTFRDRLPRLVAILGVLIVLALLAYGLASKATNHSVDESLAKGTAPLAPNFDDSVLDPGTVPSPLDRRVAPALDGGELSLAELKGTPFVLNLWASWCDPCRQEAPVLERGWQRLGPQGVLFLGLNMQDLTGDAHKFIDDYHLTYPMIRESSNDTAQAYGATGIPETYFVTARGRIVGHVVGVVSPAQLAEGALAAKRRQLVGSETGGVRRAQR